MSRRSNVGRGRGWRVFLAVAACLPIFGARDLSAGPSAEGNGGCAPVASDTLPRHVRSALSPYRDHRGVADVRRVLQRWERDGGPGSVSDSVAVAALWRRAGQYRAALSALPSDAGPDGTPRPRVQLERARILLQAPRTGPGIPGTWEERRADGGAAFWAACDGMDAATRTAIWEDLRGLTTPEEQTEWAALTAGPAACRWVRRVLAERAFRMAVSPDERLQVHYGRLHEARGRYYIRTPRLTDDLADHLGRADSLEIDDRGLIYLRMGPPLATVEPFMDLNETWAYYRPEGPRVFHFAPISKTGLHALGDFRLLENLAHASGFTMPSELLGIGGGRLAYLYQSRRVLDFLYEDARFRNMDSRMRAAGDRFNPGFQGFLAWEKELNEEDARYAVSGIPDAPELTAGIEFAYEVLRFREDGTDRTEVWWLAASRAGDLTATRAGGPESDASAVSYALRADLAYLDDGAMERIRAVSRPVVEDLLAADDGVLIRMNRVLEPAAYPYTLVLRDEGSDRGALGNWVLDTVTVSARQFGIPSISDVAVASDSGGSWSRDGRSFLRVGPTHVASTEGTAHTYFEVYGIRPGTTYDVEVRVVPEEAEDLAFDVGDRNVAFAVRFASVAVADAGGLGVGRHYLRIELGDSPAGSYRLAVRVTDRMTGIESLPAITPLLRPAVRDAHWKEAPRRRSTLVNP